MTRNAKMNPCKCCGKAPSVFEDIDMETRTLVGYFVSCDNKDCEEMYATDMYQTEQGAIDAWNRGEVKPL